MYVFGLMNESKLSRCTYENLMCVRTKIWNEPKRPKASQSNQESAEKTRDQPKRPPKNCETT